MSGKIHPYQLFLGLLLTLAGFGVSIYPALVLSLWWGLLPPALLGLFTAAFKTGHFNYLRASAGLLIMTCFFAVPELGAGGFFYGIIAGLIAYAILELGHGLTLADGRSLHEEADRLNAAGSLILPALARVFIISLLTIILSAGALLFAPALSGGIISPAGDLFILILILSGGFYLVYRGLVRAEKKS